MNLKPQTLFNQSAIEKLCSQIKLTDLQKQSALDWIKMIENNQLDKEQENQNKFEDYILHHILGYEIRECKREKLDIDYTIDLPGSAKSLCIEVKGTKTEDLFKDQKRNDDSKLNPVIQLYTYMGHGYDYGVVTNYNNFILLTQNTQLVKAHKFNFLSIKKTEDRIDENKLKEFILLFSKKEVFVNNSIEELGNQTVLSEQEFTGEFYKLFHETRLMLIKEFEESDIPHDVAIYYSQIFLNRLIFIYFVEDHNFIPSSLFEKRILGILESPSIDETTHLIFDNILGLFKIMNTGSKVQGVNGFGGGLFGDDTIPSNVTFTDLRDTAFFTECYKNSNLELKTTTVDIAISGIYAESLSPLIKNLLIMASHDFTSDLDVDILGHIFEQSISDIESLDKNGISQRKKDGVFYTPDYVTDYICRNTIIPYLSKTNKTSVIELVNEYSENLEELELKLKKLKILDPACGSGAFLVKSVDVLLEIDEEIQFRKPVKSVPQTGMDEFTKIKDINLIIENNIYGVDINRASVEITKLSLFLKLAGPETKLGYLSNNIQSGNSLIENKSDYKLSFDWDKQFPEILSKITENGKKISDTGFDIVIGNPPYVKEMDNKDVFELVLDSDFKKYHQGKMDYWYFFVHRAVDVLKEKGRFGLITNSYWYKSSGSTKMIQRIKDNLILEKCIDFDKIKVFKDVEDKHMIHLYRKDKTSKKDLTTYIKLDKDTTPKNSIIEENKIIKPYAELFTSDLKLDFIADNITFRNSIPLGDVYDSSTGIQESTDKIGAKKLTKIDSEKFNVGDGVFVLSANEIDSLNFNNNEKNILKKYLDSNAVKKYTIQFEQEYLIYSDENIRNKIAQGRYPNIQKHLDNVTSFITSVNRPYGIHRARQENYFLNPKLICKGMFDTPEFCYDENQYFVGFSFSVIFQKNSNFKLKYLLGILNSNLGKYWFTRFGKSRGIGVDVGVTKFRQFPVYNASIQQQNKIIEFVEKLELNYKLKNENEQKFYNRIKDKFKISTIPRNTYFFNHTFNEFILKIKNISKTKLTLNDEDMWDDYFKSKSGVNEKLSQTISLIENELNEYIFHLYGFSNNEINIITGNNL